MKWDGDYDGYRPFKRELLRWKDWVKERRTDKRAWTVGVFMLSLIIYSCIPTTVIQKDNYGEVIVNALDPKHFEEFVITTDTSFPFIRNESITRKEFDTGLIEVNTTHGTNNATLRSIVRLCEHHYERHKGHNCICTRNFGLFMRAACVNNSGTIDLALNIHLDKEGWSNTNKEYLVNGKLMKVADKTRVIYWKSNREKVVNTKQLQNICLMICHEGGLS